MFAIRPGRNFPPKSLDEMLRQKWEELRVATDEEIAQRKAAGAPLDDGEGAAPLEPLGDYEPAEEHAGVMVSLRAVARRHVMECDIRIKEIADAASSAKEAAEKMRADLDTYSAMRRFVSISVMSVSGLYDDEGAFSIETREDGALSDDDTEFLDQIGLLWALFSVAKSFQYMGGREKKVFGQPQAQTLAIQPSTAASAQSQGGASSGATVAPSPPGTQTHGTKMTLAPAVMQSETLGSLNVSTYTDQQMES